MITSIIKHNLLLETDEWTLLEEELNKKPHHYVHTCGKGNDRLLTEMRLTHDEAKALMIGKAVPEQRRRSAGAEAEVAVTERRRSQAHESHADYREQDEWAKLEHEIHDEHFVPPHHEEHEKGKIEAFAECRTPLLHSYLSIFSAMEFSNFSVMHQSPPVS